MRIEKGKDGHSQGKVFLVRVCGTCMEGKAHEMTVYGSCVD